MPLRQMGNECGQKSRGELLEVSVSGLVGESLNHFTLPGAALLRACLDLQDLDPGEDSKIKQNRKRNHFRLVQDSLK